MSPQGQPCVEGAASIERDAKKDEHEDAADDEGSPGYPNLAREPVAQALKIGSMLFAHSIRSVPSTVERSDAVVLPKLRDSSLTDRQGSGEVQSRTNSVPPAERHGAAVDAGPARGGIGTSLRRAEASCPTAFRAVAEPRGTGRAVPASSPACPHSRPPPVEPRAPVHEPVPRARHSDRHAAPAADDSGTLWLVAAGQSEIEDHEAGPKVSITPLSGAHAGFAARNPEPAPLWHAGGNSRALKQRPDRRLRPRSVPDRPGVP